MKSVVSLIREKSGCFPEFLYYLPLIAKAQRNRKKHPDISIEICKSLFEGISKSIIERVDSTIKRDTLDKLEVGPLVKEAAQKLRQYDNVFENDFVTRCTSTAYALGMLRNARGDISHGKGAPKAKSSDENLSKLSLQMTESLIFYMLDSFFKIAERKPEPIEVESDLTQEDSDVRFAYDDNPLFNEYLDEVNPLEGKPLYSLALYQQYYEDYMIQLEEYRDRQREQEE